ncbi:MAG: cytochrome P450, partial [Thermodesulfobacteriota bacterium]
MGALADVDFGTDPLAGEDLHRHMAVLRESAPLHRVRFFGGTALLVTRFADVREAFRDDEGLPGGPTYRMSTEPVVGRTFISMDGAEHHQHRKLAMPAFQSGAIARFNEHALVDLVHELIDRFAARGSGDLVAELTGVLPYYAITRKLGIPRARDEDMRRWADRMLSYPRDPQGALAAAAEFSRVLAPLLAERRAEPRDDLVSALAHAELEGQRLADDDVLSHVRLLFAVGATTTSHAMGNLLATLLERPELLERARREPALRAGLVHEMLRFEGPLATLPRLVTRDATIGGVAVPGGSVLLLGLASANRDPRVFDEPDRFAPERAPQDVLTFGFGVKFCPGSHLARRELLTALDAVLERLPGLRLVERTGAAP